MGFSTATLGFEMKCLVKLICLVFLGGCAAFEPRTIDTVPQNTAPYAVLFYGKPGKPHVRVFQISARNGGLKVTDYGEVSQPVYLLPGKVEITFACPDAQVHTYENVGVIRLPRPGLYYLKCSKDGQISFVSGRFET